MRIERKEFQEWLTHPVTLEVKKLLQREMDRLAHDTMETTDEDNSFEKGFYSGLKGTLSVTYDDLADARYSVSGYLKFKLRGE